MSHKESKSIRASLKMQEGDKVSKPEWPKDYKVTTHNAMSIKYPAARIVNPITIAKNHIRKIYQQLKRGRSAQALSFKGSK